jgi:hypothetical protein
VRPETTPGHSFAMTRRTFLTGLSGAPILLAGASEMLSAGSGGAPAASVSAPTMVDFARSFCYFVPNIPKTWRVRIQLQCRGVMEDVARRMADEYMLGVRTQSGAWTDPPKMPGYDFWMLFSGNRDYIKRVQTTSFLRCSSYVEKSSKKFQESGWHLRRGPAKPLRTAAEIRDALTSWRPIVGRTVLVGANGSRRYTLDYPVRWAEVAPKADACRVRTGPVILLDPERIAVGKSPAFEDFRWAYLDFADFRKVRCIVERPTSLLAAAAGQGSLGNLAGRNPVLSVEQAQQIENRLMTGWEMPVPADDLKALFQTNHYSAVEEHQADTTLWALDLPRRAECRDEVIGEEPGAPYRRTCP